LQQSTPHETSVESLDVSQPIAKASEPEASAAAGNETVNLATETSGAQETWAENPAAEEGTVEEAGAENDAQSGADLMDSANRSESETDARMN
jgi:hypothetical protein